MKGALSTQCYCIGTFTMSRSLSFLESLAVVNAMISLSAFPCITAATVYSVLCCEVLRFNGGAGDCA